MEHKTMATYTVPAEIKALKPTDIPCDVKKVKGYFYVYARGERVPDPKRPGKKKNTTGKLIGKIENGAFIPKESPIKSVTDFAESPDTLDYGAYAIAVQCSTQIVERLKKYFTISDSLTIYTIALIWFVNGFTPARDLRERYLQSVLSLKWPNVHLSENTVSTFYQGLGRNNLNGVRFEQSLLDDGSKSYAIDGHVILCTSEFNELADYGNKYCKIGTTQMNMMMVYDVNKSRPVMCSAFDGAMPDKMEVADILQTYTIRNSELIIDSGFYSEDDLDLYHENGNRFFIPVPGTASIHKALLQERPIVYKDAFTYERRDSLGNIIHSSIMWCETTVSKTEDLVNEIRVAKAEAKTQENISKAVPGEKPKKVYPQKLRSTSYGTDRLLIFKDCQMHDKLMAEYRSKIGTDNRFTEEQLTRLEPTLGVILLRTNDLEKTPEDIYRTYKKRWKIETNYNYIRNGVDYNALHTCDYYATQGISFILMVEGLIYSSFRSVKSSSGDKALKAMSVKECLVNAAALKISKSMDGTWRVNKAVTRKQHILDAFGVNVEEQLNDYNQTSK